MEFTSNILSLYHRKILQSIYLALLDPALTPFASFLILALFPLVFTLICFALELPGLAVFVAFLTSDLAIVIDKSTNHLNSTVVSLYVPL